MTTGVAGSFQN